MGTILSSVGFAVADSAKQHKVFFLASAPLTDKIVWQDGNRYTYRLRASTYSHAAALVPLAAKLNKKRWALIYPNYKYGQSAVETFKQLLKTAQPDVQFVADIATPLGKIEAGAVAEALFEAHPDAIFNVLFGADLAKLVREGENRGLFKNREVVSLLTGKPEYLVLELADARNTNAFAFLVFVDDFGLILADQNVVLREPEHGIGLIQRADAKRGSRGHDDNGAVVRDGVDRILIA